MHHVKCAMLSLLCSFMFFAGHAVLAAEHAANSVEQLIQLEKQSWEAWKNQDDAFFRSFLSDDHVEMGFGGPADKATVVNAIASHVCHVSSYSVDAFRTTVLSADTVLVNYHAAQDTTCGSAKVPSPVWVSSLYQRRGKHWLNVMYQQTQADK